MPDSASVRYSAQEFSLRLEAAKARAAAARAEAMHAFGSGLFAAPTAAVRRLALHLGEVFARRAAAAASPGSTATGTAEAAFR